MTTQRDAAEGVAFAMWKADAVRAAPNVGKHRTIEQFREEPPQTQERWMGLAHVAIASLPAATEQEPVAYTCKHGCERDALMDHIHALEAAPSDQEKRNAEIAAVVLRFIDRMNDVAPECGDPAERIVAEFAAAVQPFLTRARQIGEVG